MAEFFIYPYIAPIFIEDIICASTEVKANVELIIDEVVNMYPKAYSKRLKDDITVTNEIDLN